MVKKKVILVRYEYQNYDYYWKLLKDLAQQVKSVGIKNRFLFRTGSVGLFFLPFFVT